MRIRLKKPKFGSYGADGFWQVFLSERHVRWYFMWAIAYLLLGFWLDFSLWLYSIGLWYFILLVIVEIINTTIESIANFLTTNYNYEIKKIKDLSAASVFATGFFGGLIVVLNVLWHVFA